MGGCGAPAAVCAPPALSNLFCNRPQLRLSQDLSCFEGRMTFAWKGLHMLLKSLILNLGSRLHNACDTQQSDKVVNKLSFFFLAVLRGSVGSQFLGLGSDPGHLQWKCDCLCCWPTRKPLLSLFYRQTSAEHPAPARRPLPSNAYISALSSLPETGSGAEEAPTDDVCS